MGITTGCHVFDKYWIHLPTQIYKGFTINTVHHWLVHVQMHTVLKNATHVHIGARYVYIKARLWCKYGIDERSTLFSTILSVIIVINHWRLKFTNLNFISVTRVSFHGTIGILTIWKLIKLCSYMGPPDHQTFLLLLMNQQHCKQS